MTSAWVGQERQVVMRRRLWLSLGVVLCSAGAVLVLCRTSLHAEPVAEVDPHSWGTDHLGEPVPNYGSGTECLFCHRDTIGPRWQSNPHNRTMRSPDPDEPAVRALADAGLTEPLDILLGDGEHVRFLKKLPAYGKVAVWSVQYDFDANAQSPKDCLLGIEGARWDESIFADRCAGCHATGIDTETASMSTASLECYVCHGLTEIEHSTPEVTALLSGTHPTEARVEVSICSQCHLRGGRSKLTGRPYPTNFVAGDNLLRDFEVDFTDKALADMDWIDKHIFVNARDVLLRGQTELTCTSCHSVHGNSSEKHTEIDESEYCANCHKAGREWSEVELPKRRSSRICGY